MEREAYDDWWEGGSAPVKVAVKTLPKPPLEIPAKPKFSNKYKPFNGALVRNVSKQSPWTLPQRMQALTLVDPEFPSLGAHVTAPPVKTAPKPEPAVYSYAQVTEPFSTTSQNSSEPSSSSRRAKKPTQIDFGSLLEHTTDKKTVAPQNARPKKSAAKKDATSGVNGTGAPAPAVNALDANAPKKVRGKEREKPKPKKPSAMKKAVLQSRELKRQGQAVPLEIEENADDAAADDGVPADETVPTEEPIEPKLACRVIPTDPVKELLHSKKFRPYCDNLLSEPIETLVGKVLDTLVFYQDRAYHQQDPTKFKRRFVCGLKDVYKKLGLKEIKLIFMAPDVEETGQPGGPDDLLGKIRLQAKEHNVQVVYAMTRRQLGKKCHKPSPVSVVGVISYDVASADVKSLLELVDSARTAYQEKLYSLLKPHIPFPSDVDTQSNAVSNGIEAEL